MCYSLRMVSFNLLLTKQRRIHEAVMILQLLQTHKIPLIANMLPYPHAQIYKDSHKHTQTHMQAHTQK